MNITKERINSILEEINKPNGEGNFSDDDFRLITEMFSKILFYKMWSYHEKSGTKMVVRIKKAKKLGKELRELITKATGIINL